MSFPEKFYFIQPPVTLRFHSILFLAKMDLDGYIRAPSAVIEMKLLHSVSSKLL